MKKNAAKQVKIVPLRKKRGIIKKLVALFMEGMDYFEEYEADMVDELRDYFKDRRRDTHYFVAVLEGKIVGLIGYLRYSNDVYSIGWFCVQKNLQGHGIGTLLLKHIERELVGKARLLTAECWFSVETSLLIKFYGKCGYKPVCVFPDFYDDEDGDMILFSKRLPKRKRVKK